MRAVEEIAREYCEAIAAGDDPVLARLWADGSHARILGLAPMAAPGELVGFLGQLRAAFPDAVFELRELHVDGERAVAVWALSGTFTGPAGILGLAPGGQRVSIDVCDVIRVRDGRIDRSNVVLECAELAVQLGGLPNVIAAAPEQIADGVWVLRGGYPLRAMNAYLIEDGDGVTVYDTGILAMAGPLRAAADSLGGARRVVLGHGHSDHRAGASSLGVPVFCHPDERADAEGDGGMHYMDMNKLPPPGRWVMPVLMDAYDGPAPAIAGTLEEGDEVAGFEVVHLPGHAPGLIGLWRASDRLALVSDCFYVTDMDQLGKPGPPRVPHPATSLDVELAGESMRKLARLEPATCWPGHMDPLTGDVRAQLEEASHSWRR